MLRHTLAALCCAAALLSGAAADSNGTGPLSSRQILPDNFKPPQVWDVEKLERSVNLEKIYAKEEWTLMVKNSAKEPQEHFYIPFEAGTISRIGAFEAYEKGSKVQGFSKKFNSEVVALDSDSSTQFYQITFDPPIAAGFTKSITVSYALLSALQPRPAEIEQTASQHVQHSLSAHAPSSYPVKEQSTVIIFPNAKISEYTITPGSEPTKAPRRLTYGPYKSTPAGAIEPIAVRYELTAPLTHARLLERDVEVSHWGGNVAFEDRYWLENQGARLKNHFSRVQWQMQQYSNPATSALDSFTVPLKPLSADAYFTDDIGNVSTSRFRSNSRSAELWLKPRYPLFGGWKYSFRLGYNNDAKEFLKRLTSGVGGYVLKVPFIEGPKISEGIEYERVELRVILPEGAQNIKFATPVPLVANETSIHRTFMDTQGRPTLHLTALNLVDEWRDKELIVTYDYAFGAAYRKPLTIFAAVFAVFATAWFVGSLDVSIGKRGLMKEAGR